MNTTKNLRKLYYIHPDNKFIRGGTIIKKNMARGNNFESTKL